MKTTAIQLLSAIVRSSVRGHAAIHVVTTDAAGIVETTEVIENAEKVASLLEFALEKFEQIELLHEIQGLP